MKTFFRFLILFLSAGTASAQIHPQAFLVVSTQNGLADPMAKAVFFIKTPAGYEGKAFLRIFDADAGGAFDRVAPSGRLEYRVYGNGSISGDVPSDPFLKLQLSDDKDYDNRWRTLAVLEKEAGERRRDFVWFRMTVEGLTPAMTNKYQVFVSRDEKQNIPIEGVRLSAPTLTVELPANPKMMTQAVFSIPPTAPFVVVDSFDADAVDYDARMLFETPYRKGITLPASRDLKSLHSRVDILEEEKGGPAAIVMSSREINYISLRILDHEGAPIPLDLPVRMAPENTLPRIDAQWFPLADCNTLMLDATKTTDPDGHEIRYEWRFPDGGVSTGPRITHDFKEPGTYSVLLQVTDDSGFVAATSGKTLTMTVNAPPSAVMTAPERGVPNEPVVFDGASSSDPDGKITKYFWIFGDGARGEGAQITHRYDRPGRYETVLTVEDDSVSFCNRGQARRILRINAAPVARIEAPGLIAANETVSLSASDAVDSDGRIESYEWDFGDGETSQEINPSHAWRSPGKYSIRLRVTDDSGVKNGYDETTAHVTVNAPPQPRIMTRSVTSHGEPTPFDGKGSTDPDGKIIAFQWDFGDGETASGPSVHHIYKTPGIYHGHLSVTDDSGTKNQMVSEKFMIRVNTPPVASAGEDRVANDSEVKFDGGKSSDADDGIISHEWDFGDGTAANGPSVSHVYRFPGIYEARLTVTDGSGTRTAKADDTVRIRVNFPPAADAGQDRIVALDDPTAFSAAFSKDVDGEIVQYEWEMDGIVKTGKEATHAFDRAGLFQVRLTVTDNDGATDADVAMIRVNAPPTVFFTPVMRSAPGETIVFDAGGSWDPDGKIERFIWNFGDQSPPGETFRSTHAYASPGRYTVSLTVHDDSQAANQTAVMTRTVEINHPPIAVAGSDIATCDQTVSFDGSRSTDADGDGLSFRWDPGDGKIRTGRWVTHSYEKPGVYPVTLTVDDGKGLSNSTAKAVKTVIVNSPPSAEIRINRPAVCAGETALLDGSASKDPDEGPLKYAWDLGDGQTSDTVTAVRVFKKGGDYPVVLTVRDTSGLPCGIGEAGIVIHVVDAPIADAGEDLTICANTVAAYDASRSSGGGRPIKSYEWSFGDGGQGVGVRPIHIFEKPGVYESRLRVIVAGDGTCEGASEDTVTVTVLEGPKALFDSPEETCAGDLLALDAGASAAGGRPITAYSWDLGDGTRKEGTAVVHYYREPGVYEIRLDIRTDEGQLCNTASAVRTVRVNQAPQPSIQTAVGDNPFSRTSFITVIPETVVRFSAGSSSDPDDPVRGFYWDFGDGTRKEGRGALHAFREPGDYSVTLKATDGRSTPCSEAVSQQTVRVEKPPIYPIIGPKHACVGLPVEFSTPLPGEPIQWDFGDGTVLEGKTVSKTFAAPGTYMVQAASGVRRSTALAITVQTLPEVRVPEKVKMIAGDRVDLMPVYDKKMAGTLRFQWDMDDGALFTGEKAVLGYASPGNYGILLTVDRGADLSCLKTEYAIPVTVHPRPEITIRMTPETAYSGGARDEVFFEAVEPREDLPWRYDWNFGDGKTGYGVKVSHRFEKAGIHTVKLTVTDAMGLSKTAFTFEKKVTVAAR